MIDLSSKHFYDKSYKVTSFLLQGSYSAKILQNLSGLERCANEIISIFAKIGFTLWRKVIQFIEATRQQIDKFDQDKQIDIQKNLLNSKLQKEIENLKYDFRKSRFIQEVEIAAWFFQNRNSTFNSSKINEIINVIHSFRRYLNEFRHLKNNVVDIPKNVQCPPLSCDNRDQLFLNLLLQYYRGEFSILRAVSLPSSGNIISILANIFSTSIPELIVNPLKYLLEKSLSNPLISGDDIKILQMLNRINLLYSTFSSSSQNNLFFLGNFLERLLQRDEGIA